jgi:hypothetical protein
MKTSFISRFSLSALCIISALALTGCDVEKLMPRPDARTHDQSMNHDSTVTNGEPDYAVRYNFYVTNKGASGEVRIVTSLSCSEGSWQKVEYQYFAAGETKRMSYLFPQPSIFASDIRGNAWATP